jgi:hypothetical protein
MALSEHARETLALRAQIIDLWLENPALARRLQARDYAPTNHAWRPAAPAPGNGWATTAAAAAVSRLPVAFPPGKRACRFRSTRDSAKEEFKGSFLVSFSS